MKGDNTTRHSSQWPARGQTLTRSCCYFCHQKVSSFQPLGEKRLQGQESDPYPCCVPAVLGFRNRTIPSVPSAYPGGPELLSLLLARQLGQVPLWGTLQKEQRALQVRINNCKNGNSHYSH